MVVVEGAFFTDIDRAIRCYRHHEAVVAGQDPSMLNLSQAKALSPPYAPEEEHIARELIFDIIVGTRLNQRVSIFEQNGTATALLSRELEEIYNLNRSDVIATYIRKHW